MAKIVTAREEPERLREEMDRDPVAYFARARRELDRGVPPVKIWKPKRRLTERTA